MTNVTFFFNTDHSKKLNIFLDSVYIEELRVHMLRFAKYQIRDSQLAEDAVQEAMFSAYQNIDCFAQQAAFKTWVFSILKNKIIDLLRKEKRYTLASQLEDGLNLCGEALIEHLFEESGHWQKYQRPKKWDQPDYLVENEHFWRVFEACLDSLPKKCGRLFMMREFLEMDTLEICHNEGVSVSSLHVTLYRARLRLRECLENNWFQKEKS